MGYFTRKQFLVEKGMRLRKKNVLMLSAYLSTECLMNKKKKIDGEQQIYSSTNKESLYCRYIYSKMDLKIIISKRIYKEITES